MDYYEKFRNIIKLNIIGFFILFILSMIFSYKILKVFGYGFEELYVFGIGDALSTLMHIAFMISLVLYIPILFVSFFKFFEDALYTQERKVIIKYFAIMLALGVIGVFLGTEIAKFSVYLGRWTANLLGVKLMQSAKEIFLINFTVIMGTAACMEIFPILRIAIKLGMIKKETIERNRWIAYLIMYIAVAVLTPGDYLFGDITLFAVLVILFELTLRL